MLKAFQLRAARSVCGLGVRDIGLYLGVSGTIVSRWEQKQPLDEIKSTVTNPLGLIFFFEQYKVLFPNENSIKFNDTLLLLNSKHITRFQLRAARASFCISQSELAEHTGVPRATINYLESQDNMTFLNSTRKAINDTAIKIFFEKNGIVFPDSLTVQVTSNYIQ